jgi:hypothetical protein
MNKIKMILAIPIVTIASYILGHTTDKEFLKLSFIGRMKYYYKQIIQMK